MTRDIGPTVWFNQSFYILITLKQKTDNRISLPKKILLNLLTTNVPIIQNPVSWFADWFLYDGNIDR